MKKTLITILILAASVNMSAQFKFGVKSGVNLSRYSASFQSLIPGVVAGGYVNYSFKRVVGLQAEVLFSQEGSDFVHEKQIQFGDGYINRWRERTRENYVKIPLLLEIRPFKKIHLGLLVGVQGGYCVYRKHDRVFSDELTSKINSNNWSVGPVVGIQYLSPAHVSVGFQYGMGIISRNNVLQFTVGWTFSPLAKKTKNQDNTNY